MTTVYLASGQEAQLMSKMDNGQFLVSPIVQSGEYEYQDEVKIVNEVFEEPPRAKVDEYVKELIEKSDELKQEIQSLTLEKQTLRNEVHRIKTECNDLSKWIVDLSKFKTCKTLAFFVKDRITPVIVDATKIYKNSDRWKLSFYVDISNAKISTWLSGYHYDTSFDFSIDQEYGYLFDIPTEELVKIANERSEKMDLEKLHWSQKAESITGPYLTPRIAEWRDKHMELVRQNQIAQIKRDIEQKEKQLKELVG